MSKAISSLQGMRKLGKWAKIKSQTPKKILKMSLLYYYNRVVDSFLNKVEMLKDKFFLTLSKADLIDT